MTVLRQLRLVALLEGSSFLALLFIAMPLKYLAGLPLAVRIMGSVHGLLFLMFMAALYRAGAPARLATPPLAARFRVVDRSVRDLHL